MDLNKFKELPLMGILRDIDEDIVEPLTDTVISSGLTAIEIAMNTKDAPKLIKQMVSASKGRIAVGAGTVLSVQDLKQALDAGATFIVSPTLIDDVVAYCVKNSIPVFPGAFSPQEICNAYNSGATMVKVFPIKFFGPSYVKELKGPFKDIPILACGGVNSKNIKEFFDCGASAVAFGGSIFKKELLKEKKFSQIEADIKKLISSL